MNVGIEFAKHRSGAVDTIDADTYFQWLRLAYAARDAGDDVIAALRSAGTPSADAQAITCGLDMLDDRRSGPALAANVVSDGLPDHGIDERRSLTQRDTRLSSRTRSGLRIAAGGALVALMTVGTVALVHRPSERPAVASVRPTGPGQATAAIESRPEPIPRQQGDTLRARPSAPTPEVAARTHPISRHTPPKQTNDATAPDTAAPISTDPPRPESCPPGVDRLGCSNALGRAELESPCPIGFSRVGSSCVPTAIPQHAHAVPTGFGWECDVGFIQTGRSCTKLRVPSNAHVDFTGRSWECDSGYERAGESCRPS